MSTHDKYRAESIARARVTSDELATAAARFGIVAGPIPANDGGPASYPARMHESVDIWSSWRAMVEHTNRARRYAATHPDVQSEPNASETYSMTGFRGWPGDAQADYDASAERFNLSPSGPWNSPRRLPAIYHRGLIAGILGAISEPIG